LGIGGEGRGNWSSAKRECGRKCWKLEERREWGRLVGMIDIFWL
jgi:hypothetical protein